MATGIEMLGQMGTDQSLAGPVQGGNMVVKPDQVPVGGAAMLAKALRGQANKGVSGMYVLPEQQDQTPDFMKMAQMSVEKEMANQRNQYPNNFAESEGGIIPMLPRNLKTRPGAPETTLAYITPEEQAVLGLLNPGTPHRGPEDVPSYDEGDYLEDIGYSRQEVQRQQERAPTIDTSTREGQQKRQEFRDKTGSDVVTDAELAGRGIEKVTKEKEDISTGFGDEVNKIKESLSANEQLLLEQAQAEYTKGNYDKGISIIHSIGNEDLSSIADSFTSKKEDDDKTRKDKEKRFNSVMSTLTSGGLGPFMLQEALDKPSTDDILAKLKVGESLNPEEQSIAAGLKLANIDNPSVLTDKQLEMIEAGGGFTSDDTIQAMLDSYHKGEKTGMVGDLKNLFSKGGAIRPDGSISLEGLTKGLSRADKRLMKDLDPAMWAKLNFTNTGGGQEALGKQQYIKNKFNKDGEKIALTESEEKFNRDVMAARETTGREKERDRQQGGRPASMGGGTAPVIEDEVTEAVVEEGATTMPYTGPRTGGVEANVPLSRRFALDPTQKVAQFKTQPRTTEDMYKYYTEGTEGEGLSLEPYSEFQQRRRKALGRKPLDFWSY